MKNNAGVVILVGVLMLASISAAGLAYTHSKYKLRIAQLEVQTFEINQDVARMQALAAEANEYSKKNPAISQILKDIQDRFRAGPTQASPPLR